MSAQNLFSQLRSLVIIPVNGFLGIDSPAARNLVLGTWAHESRGAYIQQLDGGPALGFGQIEPSTHQDLLTNFVAGSRFELPLTSLRTNASFAASLSGLGIDRLDFELVGNLMYSAAITRLIYYRVPAPLPAATDLPGLAAYWKQYYNTPLGAGTADEWLDDFATLIGDPPDA